MKRKSNKITQLSMLLLHKYQNKMNKSPKWFKSVQLLPIQPTQQVKLKKEKLIAYRNLIYLKSTN